MSLLALNCVKVNVVKRYTKQKLFVFLIYFSMQIKFFLLLTFSKEGC